eukprot:5028152-Ditylum_brightwellii.AAC.1
MYWKEKLSFYENNVKIVLAALTMGVRAEEIKNLLTLFDLLYGKDFKGQFYCADRDVGCALRDSTRRSMEEALREEIKAILNFNHDEWSKKKEQDTTTCGAEPLTFVEWKKLSNDDP